MSSSCRSRRAIRPSPATSRRQRARRRWASQASSPTTSSTSGRRSSAENTPAKGPRRHRRGPSRQRVRRHTSGLRSTSKGKEGALVRDLRVLRRACAAAIAVAAILPAASSAASTVVVKTPQGPVRGIRAAGADRFLGLPYAKPPIKSLRFKAPVAAGKWKKTRDATRQGPACVQFEPTGVREEQATSEDCLYLDLYRPSSARRGS